MRKGEMRGLLSNSVGPGVKPQAALLVERDNLCREGGPGTPLSALQGQWSQGLPFRVPFALHVCLVLQITQ